MLAYLFVIFAVLTRMPFMPHPWNFTPLAAALLYFGARGSRRQLWVPFTMLAASDVILTKIRLLLSILLGSFRNLGMVCGDFVARQPTARKHKLAAGRRSRAGQFRLFLRGQQFRRMGVLGHVSQDPVWSDDLLCRRPAVLPPRNRRRHALHRNHVRIARSRRRGRPLHAQAARSRSRLILNSIPIRR